MTPILFDVYIHLRGQRPQLVGEVITDAIPGVWQHDDRELHFVTADLSTHTLTYTDVKPVPLGTAQQVADEIAADLRRPSRRTQ